VVEEECWAYKYGVYREQGEHASNVGSATKAQDGAIFFTYKDSSLELTT
jgi:hypothetical protein